MARGRRSRGMLHSSTEDCHLHDRHCQVGWPDRRPPPLNCQALVSCQQELLGPSGPWQCGTISASIGRLQRNVEVRVVLKTFCYMLSLCQWSQTVWVVSAARTNRAVCITIQFRCGVESSPAVYLSCRGSRDCSLSTAPMSHHRVGCRSSRIIVVATVPAVVQL